MWRQSGHPYTYKDHITYAEFNSLFGQERLLTQDVISIFSIQIHTLMFPSISVGMLY